MPGPLICLQMHSKMCLEDRGSCCPALWRTGEATLVERKRGKLFRDATIVNLIADKDEYVSYDDDFEDTNENGYD